MAHFTCKQLLASLGLLTSSYVDATTVQGGRRQSEPFQRSKPANVLGSRSQPVGGFYACFFLETVHQPCAAIVPSTFLQAEGGSNSSQLSQRCSPFGVS